MALLGPEGLERVAAACHANTVRLAEKLSALPGVSKVFSRPVFHELVLRLNKPAKQVLAELAQRNILGGFDLSEHYPELGHSLLVCATETKTAADLDAYTQQLRRILAT